MVSHNASSGGVIEDREEQIQTIFLFTPYISPDQILNLKQGFSILAVHWDHKELLKNTNTLSPPP